MDEVWTLKEGAELMGRLFGQLHVVLVAWAVMVVAVVVDLWAGVDSAKARGERIYSGGFRRSVGKMGDYWRIQVMALTFDVVGCCIPWYGTAYASIVVAAAIVLIEGRSVWENERAKRGAVEKLPEAIRDIIRCVSVKDAEELLKKLKGGDDDGPETVG